MRVVLLHDVTRSVCQAGHHQVAAMWRQRMAPAFAALGHTLDCPETFAADRPEAVAALMRRAGLAPEPADWARLFSDPALLPETAALIAPLEADLVLGWELSPNLLRALLQRGVPVIDMSLAPLRFAPDLFLRLRTSRPEWAEALAATAVSGDAIGDAARRVREAVKPMAAGPAGSAVLFVGQTDLDASLIAGARLAGVADHLPALTHLLDGGRGLLLKPHPHGERHAGIRLLHRHFPQARLATGNIYTLLSDPAVGTIATLSSSVAQEARWFGREAVALVCPDIDDVPELSPFHILPAHVTAPVFWDRVLHGAVATLPATPALSLRQTFSLSWGWPPLPTQPPARLTPEWLGMGRGQPGEALLRFGWDRPGPQGVCTALPLASVVLRASAPGMLDIACRAPGAAPLAIRIGLRPGQGEVAATLPAGEVVVLRLPLPASAAERELAFHLPDDAGARLELAALRLVPG